MYQISDDLFADSFLSKNNYLMFASIYGRDTAIQQLLAEIELGQMNALNFKPQTGAKLKYSSRVWLGESKRFAKTTTRLHNTPFGTIVQLWLYDAILTKPDLATRTAWLMIQQRENLPQQAIYNALWQHVQTLSNVYLLPHWQDTLLHIGLQSPAALHDCKAWITQEGSDENGANISDGIAAFKLELPENFEQMVANLVQAQVLREH